MCMNHCGVFSFAEPEQLIDGFAKVGRKSEGKFRTWDELVVLDGKDCLPADTDCLSQFSLTDTLYCAFYSKIILHCHESLTS